MTICRTAGYSTVGLAAAARRSGNEICPRDAHGQPGDRVVATDRIGDDLRGVPAFSPPIHTV
jgi:hypothetical protein